MRWKRAVAAGMVIYGASALLLALVPALRAELEPPEPRAQTAAVELAALPVASPLTLIVEPDTGIAPVRTLIAQASSSVDVVMYELTDPEIERLLVAAKERGVAVRVLLQNISAFGKHPNKPAFEYLESHGVAVRSAPSRFALTHQKTLVVDRARALVMTFNWAPRYYASSRDFGIVDDDPEDVAAIEEVFDADWQDEQTRARAGRDLVWSPGAADALAVLIDSASETLDVYALEMDDPRMVSALERAAARGVSVRLIMTYATNWKDELSELVHAGVSVHTFAASAKPFIHAKVIIADRSRAFVGSQNFSAQSLDMNRELGLFVAKPDITAQLERVFEGDWERARPFKK